MNRAPLILAIVLLLLPVLYVGSYLALVVPGGRMVSLGYRNSFYVHYRVDPEWPARVFWPLEQIDRKARPSAWMTPGIID